MLMKTPRSLDLNITAKCNLKCCFCSHYTSSTDTGEDLPLEQWLSFFKELNRCDVLDVVLSGGEPFLYKDFKKLVEGVVANRMRFSVLSNGTLISKEMAQFLASTNRCNHVQVSIDGSSPQTHDSCRGKGSFSRAIEGLDNLQHARVPTAVRVTVHRQNVYDLEEIAHFLLEERQLSGFSVNAASHLGICRHNRDSVQLTIEQRSYAMEELLKLNKKYNNRISAAAGPLYEVKTFMEMEHARLTGTNPLPRRGTLTGCGCIWNKLAVRPDGMIVPCIQMAHLEIGRINQDDLKTLWQTHPELEKLRQRPEIPLSRFSECENCPYCNYCTGNCPALAYTLTGDINRPSPDACLKLFLSEGGTLPDRSLLHESFLQ
jgi:SynChlorMet cassette radical SAM/SPASM protein ScmE